MNKDNWGKAPMGGAEISAVHLGEELLKQGHYVNYFLQRTEPFKDGNLKVFRHNQMFETEMEYFICVRPHPVLQGKFGKVKKILWSGDAFDQASNEVFYDKKIADSMDGFVFKSNWQREKILEKYYTIDPEKVNVIYNGYKGEWFNLNGAIPNPKRFIHTSTWYRGVKNFIEIWPMILEKIPDAEIHVFSKTALYSEYSNDQGWFEIAEELVKLPGMVLREPIPQVQLAHEIKKAWLMLYPNTGFVESSCGSALQSIASGTPVVATKRAGLVETIGEAGILVDNNDEKWKEKFVKETLEVDSKKRQSLVESGCQTVSNQTWKNKATEWESYLKSL
jgi:glycosyltransferase involved in cell wall biosynthesis